MGARRDDGSTPKGGYDAIRMAGRGAMSQLRCSAGPRYRMLCVGWRIGRWRGAGAGVVLEAAVAV